MAAWPSGKAEDCKSFTPSSNLGAAFLYLSKKQYFPFKMPVFERMAPRVKRYRGLDLAGKALARFMPLRLLPLPPQVAQDTNRYSMMTNATYWQA